MKWNKFLLLILALTSYTQCLLAQQNERVVEMATGMRASGKIYVVVAVLVTIFAGLVIWLLRLEKKLGQLEKEVKN